MNKNLVHQVGDQTKVYHNVRYNFTIYGSIQNESAVDIFSSFALNSVKHSTCMSLVII